VAARAAAKYLAGNITALEEEFKAMQEAAAEGVLTEEVHHDVEFHRIIVEARGNRILLDIWTALRIDSENDDKCAGLDRSGSVQVPSHCQRPCTLRRCLQSITPLAILDVQRRIVHVVPHWSAARIQSAQASSSVLLRAADHPLKTRHVSPAVQSVFRDGEAKLLEVPSPASVRRPDPACAAPDEHRRIDAGGLRRRGARP